MGVCTSSAVTEVNSWALQDPKAQWQPPKGSGYVPKPRIDVQPAPARSTPTPPGYTQLRDSGATTGSTFTDAAQDVVHKLCDAAENGRAEELAVLVQVTAAEELNSLDDSGRTALYIAASCGTAECVTALLKHHPDVNKANLAGETPLTAAIKNGYDDIGIALLDAGADPNRASMVTRITALSFASRRGNADLVQKLIAHGADPNSRDSDGRTALHCAALGDSDKAVQVLLDASADVDCQTIAGFTSFMAATILGHTEVMNTLLSAGANINAQDTIGDSAVHHCVMRRRIESLETLYGLGANFNAHNKQGQTPLHTAVEKKYRDVVISLLSFDKPVKVDAVDIHGRTPLIYAASRGCIKTAEVLLKHGADVSHPDHEMMTPVLWAQYRNFSRTIKFLVNHGAQDPNATPEAAPTVVAEGDAPQKRKKRKPKREKTRDTTHPESDISKEIAEGENSNTDDEAQVPSPRLPPPKVDLVLNDKDEDNTADSTYALLGFDTKTMMDRRSWPMTKVKLAGLAE
eukprot:TRINITY_DN95966_c0_g1_i1.p1 TRINITY_DN95966_c0_g1~~TRINITY_DN95966_c0_g1_i1.p1  ORF type:complete len:518 (+),score=47.08 TRINITY_DN95966_c0_g1_i1:100-1653(+)